MNTVDLDQTKLDQTLLSDLDHHIAQYDNPAGHLITILHLAQNLFGYLPPALQLYVAHKTGVPASRVNGVVTFYSYFVEEPKATYNIDVCLGTACFVKGSDKVLAEFRSQLKLSEQQKQTDDHMFAISDVRCIGACGLAPVVRINDKVFGHVKAQDVAKIIEACRQGTIDSLKLEA